MKLLVLQFPLYVRSANMQVYFANMTRLTYYSFALNYPNYAQYIPVDIRNILPLQTMNLDVTEHFQQGQFTVNKTGKLFSNIVFDHGQEQHHSGLLSLSHSPDQLLLYPISGRELANDVSLLKRMISQYHALGTCHHEHTQACQNIFAKYVKHEIHIEYENIFLDANDVLYNVFNETTCPLSAINCIMSPEFAGKQQ